MAKKNSTNKTAKAKNKQPAEVIEPQNVPVQEESVQEEVTDTIQHEISETDLENNPELKDEDVQVGEIVESSAKNDVNAPMQPAEVIEPQNAPVQVVNGKVVIAGQHQSVAVSQKTAEIIAKFKK